jgi:hypothetical protein
MFEITKSKGKAYKTDSPQKALEAYKNKKSITMFCNNEVMRTKCGTFSPTSNVWDTIEYYSCKQLNKDIHTSK